jgi:AcrR family transcriptional regulator
VAQPRRLTRRQAQAEQTRDEIISSARHLFATQGYSATTVTAIASHAGVSVQTIYNSVGSKAKIVHQLIEILDEAGGVLEVAERIPATSDPEELLGLAVATSRSINESCADIVTVLFSAAATEPEIRAVRDESRRRHRDGVGRVTRRLHRLGALGAGLDTSTATDILAGLTDPQVARTFVDDYGWTWDQWQSWTTTSLAKLLLRTP